MIATSYKLRHATPADAEAIRAVHVASVRGLCTSDYTPEQIDAWLGSESTPQWLPEAIRGGTIILVALYENREIVGFTQLTKSDIGALFVHPDHARQGVGSMLLTRLEDAARYYRRPFLRVSSSTTAATFYERHGFQAHSTGLHRLSTGVHIPCVKLSKDL